MGIPRRENPHDQQLGIFIYEHAEAAADASHKLFRAKEGMRITAVDYVNPTGLAQDAANYFNIKLKKGSTVIANWSTLTGAQGSIAANTFVALVLAAAAARDVAAGEELVLELDETGDATLPLGRISVHYAIIGG